MGSGHVVRCLTLATELRRRGAHVTFLCQRLPGAPGGRIEALGFPLLSLPALEELPAMEPGNEIPHARRLGVDWRHDADHAAAALASLHPSPAWLVVDHYALDGRWEQRLRPHVAR